MRDDLALVEQELSQQSSSAFEPVAEITNYLLGGGGKRLRPALLLLSAGYANYRGPGAIRLAAVVELIHSATLIHDDVIDGADTRRGRPSANSRWGNHRSVLAGDWLYMQSFQMALRERNFRILDILIELTQNMVEGELIQLTKLGRMDLTEDDALELATHKTACLFSGCARLGAVLGRSDGAAEQALADYGRYAGLAFQLVDDLLDFTASPEQLGKPVAGTDHRAGSQLRRARPDSQPGPRIRVSRQSLPERQCGFGVRPRSAHRAGFHPRSRKLNRAGTRCSPSSLSIIPAMT